MSVLLGGAYAPPSGRNVRGEWKEFHCGTECAFCWKPVEEGAGVFDSHTGSGICQSCARWLERERSSIGRAAAF